MEKKQGHSAAVLIPYNQEGKFLLQHRAGSVRRWPGYWSSFGGGIEEHEEVLEALQRELFEELRYRVREPRFVFQQHLEDGGVKHVFIEYWSGDEVFELDPKESVACSWFTLQEAQNIQIIPHDLEVLEKIAEVLQQ